MRIGILTVLLPATLGRSARGAWSNHVWGALRTPNVTAAVAKALSRPSPNVPAGVVMTTEANEYHAPLLVLQYSRLREMHGVGVTTRTVAVCWGSRTVHHLRRAGFGGQCVEGPPVPPSNFQRDYWTSFVWSKWEIMSDALLVARAALWLDADVVLLASPFAFIAPAQWEEQAELLYQPERGGAECVPAAGAACTATSCTAINSGQMLVSSLRLARLARAVRPARAEPATSPCMTERRLSPPGCSAVRVRVIFAPICFPGAAHKHHQWAWQRHARAGPPPTLCHAMPCCAEQCCYGMPCSSRTGSGGWWTRGASARARCRPPPSLRAVRRRAPKGRRRRQRPPAASPRTMPTACQPSPPR